MNVSLNKVAARASAVAAVGTDGLVSDLESPIDAVLREERAERVRAAIARLPRNDAVDELLDVRQQARFRLFEEQMERKKLDLLMRARQNAKGRRTGS